MHLESSLLADLGEFVLFIKGTLFALISLCTLLAAYVTYNLYFHPLATCPGPWIARAGLLSTPVVAMKNRTIRWHIAGLHEKYGPTVRYSANRISTIHPQAVPVLYSHNSKYEKSSFYDLFSIFTMPNAFTSRDIQEHANIRRSIASAFTLTTLLELEEFVDSVLDDLVFNLDRTSKMQKATDRIVDMAFTFQAFAFDVIGELAFGQSFGMTKRGRDDENLLHSLEIGLNLSSVFGLLPPIGLLVNQMVARLPIPGVAYIRRFSRACVDTRIKRFDDSKDRGFEPRKDMLSKLLTSKNAVTKQPLTREEVVNHSSTIVGAGADTTSITLRALFLLVLSHPEVKSKLLAEIDEALASGTVSVPISYRDGVKLVYFQACLKETLRIWPAVSFCLERVVPYNEILQLGPYTVPAGCIVGVPPSAYHTSKEIFGPDAADFKPERWLTEDSKELARLDKNMIAFGAGARICLGKNISLMEITKVAPLLFHRYDWQLTRREGHGGPHRHPVGRDYTGRLSADIPYYAESFWFTSPTDFFCTVSLRNE